MSFDKATRARLKAIHDADQRQSAADGHLNRAKLYASQAVEHALRGNLAAAESLEAKATHSRAWAADILAGRR